MNEQQSRKAFEHWATDEGKFPSAAKRIGDVYILQATHLYWQAWKAATDHMEAIAKATNA